MVDIKFIKAKEGHSILCKGHAYEASSPEGNLVCAAVSTVAQTIAYYLYSHDYNIKDKDILLKDGECSITYSTADKSIISGVEAISIGFDMLSDNYPDIVKIERI